MIKDGQTLDGAKSRFGHPIKTYDDSFGPLWAYCETSGVVGIVRAQSESDAWDIILDEILTPVPHEDIKESPKDYYVCERDYHCNAKKDYSAGRCSCAVAPIYLNLAEGCYYMPNFGDTSGIVQTDLNGSSLDELTDEMIKAWEITLMIGEEENE